MLHFKFSPIPLLFLFLSFSVFSQNRFEEGYYIDNDGSKKNVQIETKSWSTWSNSQLKIKDGGKVHSIPLDELQEFGTEGKIKFIIREVEIERSSDFLRDFDRDPKPTFAREEVVLKAIVEGDISLYLFLDGTVKKFFYREGEGNIIQLVRKKYLEGDGQDEKVMVNELYKKQLKEIAACDRQEKEIRYELDDLKQYFIDQNKCNGTAAEYVLKRIWKPSFGVSAGATAFYNSAEVTRTFSSFQLQGISPGAMLELQYKIPTIHNEININLTGYFTKTEFNEEVSFEYSRDPRQVTFSHTDIFVGIGGDYTYYLNTKNAIFGGLAYYIPFSGQARYTESLSNMDKSSDKKHPFPGLFVGYKYDRLTLKAELFFPRKLMEDTNNFKVNMSRAGISLAYQFL